MVINQTNANELTINSPFTLTILAGIAMNSPSSTNLNPTSTAQPFLHRGTLNFCALPRGERHQGATKGAK